MERKIFMIDFLQNFDWMQLLRCFVVGGIICIIGQILIDKTKLTPARILVLFVTVGAILGGLGIYQHLINFAGAGATVPLTGFGANLAKGAIEEVQKIGLLGAFTGGVKASAGGIAAAIFFGYIASLIAKPKIKKQ
jgi:stage V sporulation protein AE